MRIIKTKTYEEMSAIAAGIIGGQVLLKPNCVLGLATGSSPIGTYKDLVKSYEDGVLDFSEVRTVNLDEYCGLDGTNPNSYRYFMNKNLFEKVDIRMEATHVPSGAVKSDEEAEQYDAQIKAAGGIDLQLLGIGNNGHIAFNEASDHLIAVAHTEKLTQSTIDANARFFEKKEDVPTMAITMGMGDILAAKKVVLAATGLAKVPAIRGLIMDDVITTQNPSTMLKMHEDAVVVIDRELADAVGYRA